MKGLLNSMTKNKKVTVLLPVYNAEKYIEEAIESVLNQTYRDFRLLLIDDGSTDKSSDLIHNFTDDRIDYIKNEKNMGITKTLNRGLDLINSEYIIRMDSDDICYPNRFFEQVKFMDQNTEIVVAGTNIKKISDQSKTKVSTVATNPEQVKTELLFNSPLRHPTTILRNKVLKKENFKYSEEYIATEDYGLWIEISKKYKLTNINKVLLDYRIHEDGITVHAKKNKEKRDSAHILLYEKLFNDLHIEYTDEELKLYRDFITYNMQFTKENLKKIANLFEKIKSKIANENYDINFYENTLSKFFRINFQVQQYSMTNFTKIYRTYFKDIFDINYVDFVKFNIRNIQSKFSKRF